MIKNYLNFIKKNKNSILLAKLLAFMIINIWLLIVFWKILLIPENVIINNNVVLGKVFLLFQPLLNVLGLGFLTPNVLKMLIITIFIIIFNLLVLYFSQMAALILMTSIARYSYKSYANYLISKDNLNYMGFVQCEIEKAPVIIEKTTENTSWFSFSTACWIAGGIIIIVCCVYGYNKVYNNTTTPINPTNEITSNATANFSDQLLKTNQALDYTNKEVSILDDNIVKLEANFNNKFNLLNLKIDKKYELLSLQLRDAQKPSGDLNNIISEVSAVTNSVEAVGLGLAQGLRLIRELTEANYNTSMLLKRLLERVEVVEAKLESMNQDQSSDN